MSDASLTKVVLVTVPSDQAVVGWVPAVRCRQQFTTNRREPVSRDEPDYVAG